MITNLTNLMSIVKEEELEYKETCSLLNKFSKNKKTIEVKDGSVYVLEDNSDTFDSLMKRIEELETAIDDNKSVIFAKNNSLILPNGYTIQQALNSINNKKTLLRNLEMLKNIKTTKERCTEVNNSYYIETTPSFSIDKLMDKINTLKSDIFKLEFEISKLNSEEFEV